MNDGVDNVEMHFSTALTLEKLVSCSDGQSRSTVRTGKFDGGSHQT